MVSVSRPHNSRSAAVEPRNQSREIRSRGGKAKVRAENGGRQRSASGFNLAYDYIKTRILSLALRPGMSLAELDLVNELKVSRTPVREALIKLASEGLVKLELNRGAWVSEVTLSHIRQFFEAFEVAQRMVTRWAAVRYDPKSLPLLQKSAAAFEDRVRARDIPGMHAANYELHAAIAANCGNSFVEEYYLKLLDTGTRISHIALLYESSLATTTEAGGLGVIVDEHRKMLRHIVSGQADEAEELARQHVVHFRERVLNYLLTSESGSIDIKN
jgi:DNA-binding GntR family transcriptional regulator